MNERRSCPMRKARELPYHFGVKMQVYPSSVQKRVIEKNIEFARFFWNMLVDANKEISKLKHDASFVWPWVDARIERLKEISNPNCKAIKDIYPFARDKELDSNVPMQVKANYAAAWNLCKKGKCAQPPTFHKKKYSGSYQTSNSYNPKKFDRATIFIGNLRFIDAKHIRLNKVGIIRVGISKKRYRRLVAMCESGAEVRITKATVSRDACGDYFVSFQMASDMPIVGYFEKTGTVRGIDLNLSNFLTDSDGSVVDNPRFARQAKTQLSRAKRKLSRLCSRAKSENRPLPMAKNYQKQRIQVARIHRRVRRRRNSFLNELSTAVIRASDCVSAEDLRIKEMMQNHSLARAIADAGWRMFLNMLEYKARMRGKQFCKIDPRNTTQTCSHCGHVLTGASRLTLKDRTWTCPSCGSVHDRDWNAARNILARAVFA